MQSLDLFFFFFVTIPGQFVFAEMAKSSLLNVNRGIMKPLCTVTHFYRTEPTLLLSFHIRPDMLCQAFQTLASIKR